MSVVYNNRAVGFGLKVESSDPTLGQLKAVMIKSEPMTGDPRKKIELLTVEGTAAVTNTGKRSLRFSGVGTV